MQGGSFGPDVNPKLVIRGNDAAKELPGNSEDFDNIDQVPEPEIILDSLPCASPSCTDQYSKRPGDNNVELLAEENKIPVQINKEKNIEDEQNVALSPSERCFPTNLENAESALQLNASPEVKSSPVAPTILITADEEDIAPEKDKLKGDVEFHSESNKEDEHVEDCHFSLCRELNPSPSLEIIPMHSKDVVPWEGHRDFNPWALSSDDEVPVVYTPPECDEITGLRFQEEALQSHARADGIPHGRNEKVHHLASPWGEESYVSHDRVSYSTNANQALNEDDIHQSHRPSTHEQNLELYKLPTLLEHMQDTNVTVSKPNHVGQEVDEYRLNSESLASYKEVSTHSDHAVRIVVSAAVHAQTTVKDLMKSSDGLLVDSDEAVAAVEAFSLSNHSLHADSEDEAVQPAIHRECIPHKESGHQHLDFREPLSVHQQRIENFTTESIVPDRVDKSDHPVVEQINETCSDEMDFGYEITGDRVNPVEEDITKEHDLDLNDSVFCEKQILDKNETRPEEDILQKETRSGPEKVAAENLRVGEPNFNVTDFTDQEKPKDLNQVDPQSLDLKLGKNVNLIIEDIENIKRLSNEQSTEALEKCKEAKLANSSSETDRYPNFDSDVKHNELDGIERLISKSDDSSSGEEVCSPRSDDWSCTSSGSVLKPKPPPGRPVDRRCNTAR